MLEQQGLHEELQKKKKKERAWNPDGAARKLHLQHGFFISSLTLLFFAHKLDNVSQKLKSFLEESPIESNN